MDLYEYNASSFPILTFSSYKQTRAGRLRQTAESSEYLCLMDNDEDVPCFPQSVRLHFMSLHADNHLSVVPCRSRCGRQLLHQSQVVNAKAESLK